MKKKVDNMTLIMEINEDCEQTTRTVMNGALSLNKKEAHFVESAPRRAHTRNTKVWDGELLSMIVKPNGAYQVHSKNVNPTKIDNFPQRMFNEACAILLKIKK